VSGQLSDADSIRSPLKRLPHAGIGIRSRPIFMGLAKTQSVSTANRELCFHRRKRSSSSREMPIVFLESRVLVASTCCATIARSTLIRDPSQSTSSHRKPSAFEMRRPIVAQHNARVAKGSGSSFRRARNCSTVRFRACRTLFVAPGFRTSDMGCVQAPRHQRTSQTRIANA
jgi:hypothetical protein